MSYRPEYAELVRRAAELGLTDAEIAHMLGRGRTTLWRWAQKHPELAEALKTGKEGPDERVQRALYHRAVGYSFDSEKIFVDRKTGKVTRVPYVEHVPPDTVACIFWLKNRQPDLWRDKVDHEHAGKDGGPIQVETLSDEEVDRELVMLLRKVGLPKLMQLLANAEGPGATQH